MITNVYFRPSGGSQQRPTKSGQAAESSPRRAAEEPVHGRKTEGHVPQGKAKERGGRAGETGDVVCTTYSGYTNGDRGHSPGTRER